MLHNGGECGKGKFKKGGAKGPWPAELLHRRAPVTPGKKHPAPIPKILNLHFPGRFFSIHLLFIKMGSEQLIDILDRVDGQWAPNWPPFVSPERNNWQTFS